MNSQKKNSTIFIFVIVFMILFVGITMFSMMMPMMSINRISKITEEGYEGEVTGRISRIDSKYDEAFDTTKHTVYVTYEVDGKVYEDVVLNVYSSTMRENQKIDLLYDEDNPENVTMDGVGDMLMNTRIPMIIFMIAFFLITFAIIFVSIKKVRTRGSGYPYTSGTVDRRVSVWGTIDKVHSRIADDGNLVYHADCVIYDNNTGERRIVKSNEVSWDLLPYVGMNVSVLVDKNNPNNCYVDLDGLVRN